MRQELPESGRLLDEAIDLMIRLQNDPGNPVASDMVRAWCARGPEHEAAWARVAAIHGAAGKVMENNRRKKRREGPALSRRSLMIGGIVGLAAVGSGALYLPDLLIRSRADYVTGTGEIRRIILPDNSVATLGPDSAIALDYSPVERRVQLLAGMSFFEVAKQTGSAFIVTSGDIAATALGTAFDMSSDAGVVTVSVDHGLVETKASASFPVGSAQLGAGDWIAFNEPDHTFDRGRLAIEDIGAWRDRRIVADRERVSTLVAQISRWLPGRVVMADPYIGTQKVSGVFDLSTPERALEAVVLPAGGKVRRLSSLAMIITPI